MPTLNWIGKEAAVKHHNEVPYCLLEPVAELSGSPLPQAGEGLRERGVATENLMSKAIICTLQKGWCGNRLRSWRERF